MLVENGGFGAQAAAPIARKVLDYYLLGAADRRPGAGAAPATGHRRRERLMVELPRPASGRRSRGASTASCSRCALAIVGVGLVTLFSAADQSVARRDDQVALVRFALVLMWIVANIPPQTLARAAVPLYVLGGRCC